MSWSIALIDNTVSITKALAKKLFEIQKYEEDDSGPYFYSEDEVVDGGRLQFNPDHEEHMDYLSQSDEIVDALKAAKVKGVITFGSLEGDDDGSFWGYRFDGNGGMVRLKGEVVWSVDV